VTAPQPGGDNPLDALNHIQHIEGDLVILDVAGREDLSALSGLESINGYVMLEDNPDLTDFTGLDSMTNLAWLRAKSNPKLRTVGPFPNAKALAALDLHDNPVLEEVVGLEGVTELESSLFIEHCPSLTSLAGLENVEKTRSVIIHDTGLQSLADLAALEEVSMQIRVEDNANFRAFDMPSLQHLNPRSPVSASLHVTNNPKLPSCEVDDLIEQIDFEGKSLNVEGNTGEGDCSQ